MKRLTLQETLRTPFRTSQGFFGAIRFAMVLSLAGRAVGYLRQILVAYYFGIARGLDIYYMTYAIATLIALSFSSLFDQIAVPHMVRAKEHDTPEGYRELTGAVFSFSVAFGAVLSLVFIASLPLTTWAMAHGFTPAERRDVMRMAFYFLPWTLLCMPVAALGAICKSQRAYATVLKADFLVSMSATAAFVVWHASPTALPLTFAAGNAVSFIWLLSATRPHAARWGSLRSARLKPIYRNFLELFTTNQIGSLSSAIARFFQSYLQPGAISALACADQTVLVLMDFLNFKELFMVPLSSVHQRKEKLERLVLALILLTVPVALFLSAEAPAFIGALFQRGQFDQRAKELTAVVFSVLTLNLVFAVVGHALYRMFQVTDTIRFSMLIQVIGAAVTAALAPVFIFQWKLDAVGWALTSVGNAVGVMIAEYALLRTLKLDVDLRRVGKYFAYALAATGLAVVAMRRLPPVSSLWIDLASHGVVFSVVILGLYWPLRGPIESLLYGEEAAA